MALADIFQRTRTILYGTGVGEQPTLILAESDAAEAIIGGYGHAQFALDAGEGDKVAAGYILSVYDPDTEGDAHVFYVLSVATDTVTAINGYLGSPAIAGADSGDLDYAYLEVNPLATGFEIFEAIDTIIANYLWPYVYEVVTSATIASPDLVDGQEAVAAAALEIISAHQSVGGTIYRVPFERYPSQVSTSLASTGRLGRFDWVDASTGYYAYKAKLTEANVDDDQLRMIATGAAALVLGGHLVDAALAGSQLHNQEGLSQRERAGSNLWRDFLTMRQGFAEELSRDGDIHQVSVNRG